MVVRVSNSNLVQFISYCRRYGVENDDSFLPDEDFSPDDDHPSFLLYDEQSRLCGAASLILEEHYRKARKGRFMIFHSIEPLTDNYRALLSELLSCVKELDSVYLFISPGDTMQQILEGLGFGIERYSFLMIRRDCTVSPLEMPKNSFFVPFDERIHRDLYCKIINEAFGRIAGHFDITPERVSIITDGANIPTGGIQLLYLDGGVPAGLFFSEINEEGMLEVGPIAVLPQYQRRGLGRLLLNRVLQLSSDLGLDTVLSVNAENEKAVSLYLKEGFQKTETKICYRLDLRELNMS